MEETKQIEKTAIVFDTNFIFKKYKQLDEIVQELTKKQYVPYVSQMTIYEYKNIMNRNFIKETNSILNKYKHYIEYKDKKNIEEILEDMQRDIHSKMELLFKDRVISYNEDSDTYKKIINRAIEKQPPFVLDNDKHKSDKGFKDTIIWLSILEYFKSNNENEVIFVSDDSIFSSSNTSPILINEFQNNTNKNIIFKGNNEFLSMISYEIYEKHPNNENKIKNEDLELKSDIEIYDISNEELETIRNGIENTVYDICFISAEYGFNVENTFILTEEIDVIFVKKFLINLEKNINKHILDRNVPISEFIDNNEIFTVYNEIDIKLYQSFLGLNKYIQQNYPFLLPQFYSVVTKLMNKYCFQEPKNNNHINTSDDEIIY